MSVRNLTPEVEVYMAFTNLALSLSSPSPLLSLPASLGLVSAAAAGIKSEPSCWSAYSAAAATYPYHAGYAAAAAAMAAAVAGDHMAASSAASSASPSAAAVAN